MQATRNIPALAGLLILTLLVGSHAQTCTEQQYLAAGSGSCVACPDERSTTEAGDNVGVESCLCVDNYFRNPNGECERCPSYTVSTRGANQNISGCSCVSGWVGGAGVCLYCGQGGYAMPPDNTEASDCECRDYYYGSGGYGTCQRCPFVTGEYSSRSTRGANPDISSCTCPNNWYGENGDCKRCPTYSYSTAPNNKYRSSCVCSDNRYMDFSDPANENVTECRSCTADFPNTFSQKGSNFVPSDCKCLPSFYGSGGSDCTRCPIAWVTGPLAVGGMWLASVVGENEDPDWKVSCNKCGSGWAGTPIVTLESGEPVINRLIENAGSIYDQWPYYEITNCMSCSKDNADAALIRSWPGENDELTDCQCRATEYIVNDTSSADHGKCKDCPGSSRSVSWENYDKWPYDVSHGGAADVGISSCLCDFSVYHYGPADDTCPRCPTNSWREDETAASSSISDCKCRPGYYATDGTIDSSDDTCSKCPSGSGWSSYSFETGSTALSDCKCSNGYYGPVEGAPACKKCPEFSTSIRGENDDSSDCVCKNNYYRLDDSTCEPCPNNGRSIAGQNTNVESCSCPDNFYGVDSRSCTQCAYNDTAPANGWVLRAGHSVAFDNEDLSKCSCPSHWYGPNAESCTQCPSGTVADRLFGGNVAEESCSCLDNQYGVGYGSCTDCPAETISRRGSNYALASCSCPTDFYGPGQGDCTPCPDNSTSVKGYNYGVYACQCPEGKAMSYNWFIAQAKQPAQCVEHEYCDGVIDKISNKCWKLFERTTRQESWDDARTTCQEWGGVPAIPDAFINNPDYIPTPGDLPSIVTNEDLVLSTIFFDDFGYQYGQTIWVGATDQETEGTWKWTDGSTYVWQDSLWANNQPDNRNGNQDCAWISKAWFELPVNTRKPLLDDVDCTNNVVGALCTKSPNKCISGNNVCSPNAECVDRDFGTGYFGYTCECHDGHLDVNGDGTVCQPAIVKACNESLVKTCHHLANCHILDLQPDLRICSCPEGMTGDGVGENGCKKNSWTVRAVIDIDVIIPETEIIGNDKLAAWPLCKESISRLFFGVDEEKPIWFTDTMHHSITEISTDDDDSSYQLVINGLFETETAAQDGMAAFNSWTGKGVYACTGTGLSQRRADAGVLGNLNLRSILAVSPDTVQDGTPGVYTWTVGTTSDPIKIAPTGMEVERVYFKPDCLATGCWVVDVLYTRGENNFVSFYLPHAVRMGDADTVLEEGAEDLSYDYDYEIIPNALYPDVEYQEWQKAPETTFFPKNFPCRSHDYEANPAHPPRKLTSCCIPEFRDMYRPVKSFYDETNGIEADCSGAISSVGRSAWDDSDPGENVPVFGTTPDATAVYTEWPSDGLVGGFAGMALSHVEHAGVVDPFIGQFKARFMLDEKELRELAGKLLGTVGVEHTVDTFIGLAEFKPTGIKVFDPFATQVNIHLEKTSFFTVSTHGVNDYTFLEYINLRLVAVYDEDTDPTETVAQNGERTSRTNSTGAAHYVQVTFTLGDQYKPIETGLIPLDSVRVGQGTFIDEAFHDKDHTTSGLFHACSQYDDDSFDRKSVFDARIPNPPNAVSQQCAPSAAMCVSPQSIPDQFVVFNIPLGIDWFPEASSSLSENVFVDLVVSAIDDVATGQPNNGADPQQMKTTLTASIPVVQGGINIFCDQITAKTDLTEVVKAHLIIGSAMDASELSRLTIFEDIASSDMRPVNASLIDTDSIEAGLMTMVLEGDASYFGLDGASTYGVQLEDVITLHLMEPADTKFDQVKGLLATPGADNNDQNGLDTDGYTLNGAFRFVVDRVNFRAYLEPTDDLLAVCPFNPPRPSANVPFPSTCVLRRDIRRRTYPARTGALSTAVEIPAVDQTDRHTNGVFMTTLLGDNDYAYGLGQNFSQTVADKYTLNGQWKRAYMINPGYEWTPTQTGGQSIFTVSQKIVLFALINLDEVFNENAPDPTYTLPETRPVPARRMLLQKNVQNSNAGLSGAELTYQSSYKQIIASSYDVPEDRIATLKVVMELDMEAACNSEAERHEALAATMLDYLTQVSSPLQNVLLLSHSLDMQGALCARRNGGRPSVDMEVLVAFAAGTVSKMNTEALQNMAGVLSVSELDVSPKVSVDPTFVPDHGMTPTGGPGGEDSSDGSSSDNTALIAGICGGVGGLVVIGAAAMFLMRGRGGSTDHVQTVQAVDVNSLKAQLADDA